MMLIAFKLQAIPEKRQELRQTLEAIMEKTSDMRDCVRFARQQDPENRNAITLVMEWRSPEAFSDQQQAEHFGVLLGAFNLLCVSKKMQYDAVNCVEPGRPAKIEKGIHGEEIFSEVRSMKINKNAYS